MESSLCFPPSEACDERSVPDGYPYVCPKCGSQIPDVLWDEEAAEFCIADDLVLTAVLDSCLLVFRVADSEHSRVGVFSVLHQC
jgi:hypothetical protein